MTLSARNEEKVRSALATLVDATPVGAEFDALIEGQLTPTRRQGGGALAFGAAFLVVGLIGGFMLWATLPTNGPDPATAQDLTWAEWFERTRADSIQVHDSPLVLQGLPGPEPQFDVTALGEQQTVTTLTPDTDIDWSIFEWVADQALVISGQTPESGYVGVARYEFGSPAPGQDGPHVCTFELSGEALAMGCSGASRASDDMVRYGASFASTEDPEGNPDTLTITTPPGASVVAIGVAGDSYWQRPNGNMATFVGGFTRQQVDIVIYDAQGNVLYEESTNL